MGARACGLLQKLMLILLKLLCGSMGVMYEYTRAWCVNGYRLVPQFVLSVLVEPSAERVEEEPSPAQYPARQVYPGSA
jgi:hypothetical protein